MLNIVRADFYKSFHRVYLYIVILGLAGLSVVLNALCAHEQMTAEAALSAVANLLVYPLFVICMFADMITAEESKEHTFKNTVASGLPRYKLYLAKNISTVLVGFVAAFVVLAVYVLSALVLMPSDGTFSSFAAEFAPRLGTALLLYVAACTLATLLGFLIKKNALFSFSYFGLLVVPLLILRLLSMANPLFGKIGSMTLYRQTQLVASVPPAQLTTCVTVALIHMAVFLLGGALLFKRQEIV